MSVKVGEKYHNRFHANPEVPHVIYTVTEIVPHEIEITDDDGEETGETEETELVLYRYTNYRGREAEGSDVIEDFLNSFTKVGSSIQRNLPEWF